jgi:hypothetical protein
MLTQKRLIEYGIFNPDTDPTPLNEIRLYADHPSWAEPKQLLYPFDSSNQNDVLLGGNLISSSGWTSAGWTGNESIGWTHTTGNTTVLSNVLAAVIDHNYQIQIIVTGRTAGSVVVGFGGDISIALNSSAYWTILATTNDNLEIIPTTDFDGTITISLKEVTWQITEEQILAILGLTGVTIASQAWVTTGFVAKVGGKSLILDTEITRLAKSPAIYSINLPAAANLAAKIAAATEGTDYPTGWVLTATDTVNLTITHGLIKEIDHVTVKKVVGAVKTILKPYSTAYSEVTATTTSILVIEGIDPTATQTLIHLTFLP